MENNHLPKGPGHSSGPWRQSEAGLQIFAGRKHIATVHYAGNPIVDINEALANARIIGKAPELFEAVTALCDALESKLIAEAMQSWATEDVAKEFARRNVEKYRRLLLPEIIHEAKTSPIENETSAQIGNDELLQDIETTALEINAYQMIAEAYAILAELPYNIGTHKMLELHEISKRHSHLAGECADLLTKLYTLKAERKIGS